MEIIFKGRLTDVPARFKEYAVAKLNKFEKLDQKAIRVDVELSVERNPRQASQKERVELTIRSRGPAIRAEAAAEDRMAALDLALAKLDSRLRRALDRRKNHYGAGPALLREAQPRGAAPGRQEAQGQAAGRQPVPGVRAPTRSPPRRTRPFLPRRPPGRTSPRTATASWRSRWRVTVPSSSGRSSITPSRSRLTRRCWRWSSWAMISTYSMTSRRIRRALSTGGTATSTGLSG